MIVKDGERNGATTPFDDDDDDDDHDDRHEFATFG